MIIDKATAISSLVPSAEYALNNDTGEVLWINPTTAPVTDAQINTELARLQADYANKDYQRKRASEYPSFADQFDTIFHNGLDAWKAQIQAVKDKYPKQS